jgi:hypothetical protein
MERAQRAVGQPVHEEVQVVEDDQGAELDRGISRAAHGHRQDRVGAQLLERADVRLMRHRAAQSRMAFTVARDVQHVGAGERPDAYARWAEARLDLTRLAVEPGQRVGPRPGDDADAHRPILSAAAGARWLIPSSGS